ncbi:MAG: PspA/IM30 family protein, partial [Verrucomicrobiota bacterium]
MADNLFQAIHNWFRAKNQEAAEALSDPVRDGKLAITDSEKQIEGFTSKIATLIAETKSLERQTAESTSEVSKYQAVAAQALQAGNEADARDAITLKQKA